MGGELKVGLTDFENGTGYNVLGVFNLPVSDTLSLRAAVNVEDHDGYVENVITQESLAAYEVFPYEGTSDDDRQDEETVSWRVSALWNPSDTIESFFNIQGTKTETSGPAYSLLAANPNGFASFATGGAAVVAFQNRQSDDFWSTREGMDSHQEMDTVTFSNTTAVELSDTLTLKNIVSYREYDVDRNMDFDGMPFQVLDVTIDTDGDEWTEELQLQKTSERLDWAVGIYLSGQDSFELGTTLALAGFGLVPSLRENDVDNTSQAIFAQGTYRFSGIEDLSLTVGGRVTKDEREMQRRFWADTQRSACSLRDENGDLLPLEACEFDGKESFTEPTYTISLEYKFDDQTMVYLAHRKGYRSGGFDYTAPGINNFQFDPEFVKDFEVGLKKDWSIGNGSLRTNLAIYDQDYDDIQRFSAPEDQPTNFFVLNAAAASITGGELEVTLIPVQGLEISGFYSYIDASYDDFVTGAGNFTDNEFAQVPEHQYSLRFAYTLPLDPSVGEITLRADYFSQSEVFYSDTSQGPEGGPLNSQSQDDYDVLNLRVDWESVFQSHFDLAFYVKNAQEEEYNQFGVMLWASLGYNVATIDQPRIFGLEARYRF